MRLSRESEYGLAGVIYLAGQRPGAVLTVKAVADAEAMPRMFLAKTFARLARHGILRSYRGRRRGYELARRPQQINVREVLEGIEGPDLFARCIFRSGQCSDRQPCVLHAKWAAVRPQLEALLAATTLADCARDGGAPSPASDGVVGLR